MGKKNAESISRLSRVLSAYHLFLNCDEVSLQEFSLNFGVGPRTAHRDIRLLRQAGVLKARYDRTAQAFLPVSLELFPMEEQENQTRQKYLEKLRRLCILMCRVAEEDDSDGMNKVDLYREILPDISDRTRQRDFNELEKLGYCAWYARDFEDEPGRWHYEIPGPYELKTIPRMKQMEF